MIPGFPLETERLLLREFQPEDEAAIYEYASDPEVVRYADWGPSDLIRICVQTSRNGRVKMRERNASTPAVAGRSL